MKKLIISTFIAICIICLFLFIRGKIGYEIETAQGTILVTTDTLLVVEPELLTEAEAWKLFDAFWLEFQSAVANDRYEQD